MWQNTMSNFSHNFSHYYNCWLFGHLGAGETRYRNDDMIHCLEDIDDNSFIITCALRWRKQLWVWLTSSLKKTCKLSMWKSSTEGSYHILLSDKNKLSFGSKSLYKHWKILGTNNRQKVFFCLKSFDFLHWNPSHGCNMIQILSYMGLGFTQKPGRG